jgi:hypothetical protein
MSNQSALALATGNVQPATTGNAVSESTALEGGAKEQAPLKNDVPPSQPNINSKAFSHLAKKEAELQRQRQEINAEKAKIDGINKQYNEFLRQKKEDPIAALKTLGFSEADVFNYMAAQQPVEQTPEEKAVAAASAAAELKIKAFEEAQAKKELEQQKAADNTLIRGYRNDVAKVIQSDPNKFEYCAYHGPVASDLIYETVLAVVKNSGGKDVPDPHEAAEMVEEYYEQQDQAMMTLKKRQPKLPASTPPPAKEPERTRTLVEKPKYEPPKPARTLTKNATVTAASAKSVSNETRDQKRERLMQRLRDGI